MRRTRRLSRWRLRNDFKELRTFTVITKGSSRGGKTRGGQNRRRSYAANRRADQEWDIPELAADRPREIGAPCASRRMGRTADMLTLPALALFQTNSVGTLVDELIGGSS